MRRACLAALAFVAAACRAPVPEAPPSVLLVTIDTLRADRVGAYGAGPGRTPHLDALAAQGLVMEDAWASVPLTLPSHATILSGLEPPHHGVHDNGAYVFPSEPPTLATVLKERGYATGAFVGAYVLDRRFGLARGFDHYDDRIERNAQGASVLESERRGEEVAGAAEAWIGAQTRPFLAWVHLYDPHAPYDPPSPQREAFAGRPYEGEVAYADACFGRVLAAARARAGARLLVAVTADHGEGLGEHGERTHGFFVYGSTLRVPMVLAGPGLPVGERRRGVARSADLMPTLLARLGVPALPRVDGADLLAARPNEAYAESLYPQTLGWAPLHAFRVGSLRYVDAPRPELYDLADDPGETRNRVAERPQEAARLRAALAALRAQERAPSRAAVDAATAERLGALGYVAGAAAPPPAGTARDPKDALPLWQRFEEANWSVARGDHAGALPALRGLVHDEPGNAAFRRALSTSLRRTGRAVEAAALLAAGPAPDAAAWYERALALADAGRVAEAIGSAERALALDPSLPEVHNHLGVLRAARGELPQALAAFDEAVRLDTNNALGHANRGNALRSMGRLPEAKDAYEAALRASPRNVDALNGLGTLAVLGGAPDEAVTLFQRALGQQPDLAEARLNLAVAELKRGRPDAARAAVEELLRRSPARDVAARARLLLAQIPPDTH
ncbi:MAG: sulfatase-like hydrolase/transferase [Vicinamibacteria bacterium]